MRRCKGRRWGQRGGSLEAHIGTSGVKAFKGFNLNLCGDCCEISHHYDLKPEYNQAKQYFLEIRCIFSPVMIMSFCTTVVMRL